MTIGIDRGQTEETKVLTVDEKMREFITDTLGIEYYASTDGLRGAKVEFFRHGSDTHATFGYTTHSVRSLDLIVGNKHRVDLVEGLGSASNRLIGDMVAKFVTPAGINFEDSCNAENVEYLKNIVAVFVEFYNRYLRMPCVQPFLYVDYEYKKSGLCSFVFQMGHGDITKPVPTVTVRMINYKLLDKCIYNISETEINSVGDLLNAVMHHIGNSPFDNENYTKINWPSIHFTPAGVGLLHLREGRDLSSGEHLYNVVVDLANRVRGARIYSKPISLVEKPIPYADLPEVQKHHMDALYSLVRTSFAGLVSRKCVRSEQA